ncbi:MAG: type II secretion system protein M [Gammaproteobacteria bacterium]|nr:type II secretion system protein M [Gammaproteobacteria bacterium]
MREFWLRLQLREQLTLMVAALLLLLLLFYLQFFEPFLLEQQGLDARLAAESNKVAEMQAAAAEVRLLQRHDSGGNSEGNQSLLTLTDTTARQQGLSEAIKRIQPDGETVQIWLEGANYEAMLGWLHHLQQSYQVVITGAVIDKMDNPGLVKARLVVSR